MGRYTIETPWEDVTREEITDATLSLTLKKQGKRYGEYSKRLAEVLKDNLQIPKGEWQKVWTVATRVFNFLYRGHSEKVVEKIAIELGREFGVDGKTIFNIVSSNLEYILGGRKAGSEEVTTTRRVRARR